MAFAQLTYRESLRDIETCLSIHASKLYHMGFRQPVRRSTLADANERRDWRIHAALAQRLITQARTLYVDEELGLDLTNTVYALDSTTIALCLSVFPWAHFRTTKAAVKMHTLLDLRGNIPSFIHISDGCQWRSKKGPPRRCKKGPLGGCGLVPVVHGRAPRATRRALNRLTRRRAREGPVGPRGQAWAGWSVQLAVGV